MNPGAGDQHFPYEMQQFPQYPSQPISVNHNFLDLLPKFLPFSEDKPNFFVPYIFVSRE